MIKASPSLSPGKTGSCGPVRSLSMPTDCLGFYVICFIGIVGVALACRIQVAYSPSIWVHLVIALPPVLLGCLLPIRLLKGWLNRKLVPLRGGSETDRTFGDSIAVNRQAAA